MIVPALVPAAGRSERMGRPKLLLPIGERTLIGHVTTTLLAGGAAGAFVVTPPADRAITPDLLREVAGSGGIGVPCDEPTGDMRATVEHGLAAIRRAVPDFAAILLAPGDCPGLTADLVREVLALWRADPARIVIPARDGRRGHPLVLPRAYCDRIAGLPEGTGINTLIRSHPDAVALLPIDDDEALVDLDTPEDYRRWTARA